MWTRSYNQVEKEMAALRAQQNREWRERRENLGAESRVGEAGSSRSPARSRTATQAALEMLQKSPHSLCCPRLS